MRKIICCALALLLMMGAAVVPAAAAEKVGFYDFQTVDGVAITAMDEKGPVTDGSDRMEVVYSKATSGCNYIVCLVEGASLDVLKTDTKKVYYINEENKASSTSVTFDVVPMLPTKDMDMTLFITSDDGKANVSVSMKYAAGASASFKIGDVNADGVVDAADRMTLARYLAGWSGYEERIKSWEAAHINDDEFVDAADRMILARYLAGWSGYDKYFK